MKTLVLTISLLACCSAWSMGKDSFTLSEPGELMRDVMNRRNNVNEFIAKARQREAQEQASKQTAQPSPSLQNNPETTTTK